MLENQFNALEESVEKALAKNLEQVNIEESGTIVSIDSGIARVKGLTNVKNEELIAFPNGTMGLASNLDYNDIGVILLGGYDDIKAGQKVKRTHKVADIPVSEEFLGRIISPLGKILDDQGSVTPEKFLPLERKAPSIVKRAPVLEPLQTGLKVIDSLVPIGKGQRELIIGDRQTGKTTIAIDTIINQKDTDVVCIYCTIGQQITSVSKIIKTLKAKDAIKNTIVMVAGSEDPAGVQYIAPYAAISLAEYFMEKGRDVLIVYDDLTSHARGYRELSLLLERPPGREAYPGDIFYIHSKLLERSTHLKNELGGGSITSLPIIETQAENLSAYIPTNLISITDGQIYLSPRLYQKGNLPAVQIGLSVSRIGAKTQLPSYRNITSALKLTYSQFEELESFASFGTRLDDSTRRTLERGWRIRQILNQPQHAPIEVTEQIGVLMAVTMGVLDEVALDRIVEAEEHIRKAVREDDEFRRHLLSDEKLKDDVKNTFIEKINELLKREMDI
ncbi:F-type H+-transporting ATPase subunit alpha [Alkalibacterium subtropicum]|uniref:ATP synthase subunit alpha n=1 Tax=Alkalibacterium subtropicum TaxID=753702 RepID=A0A1I1HRP7_9LACT|nr:F0F1 ATP synthase subunit alpha [Alkalibacterium subtropicum]SFC24638.1 F-type H+-transporting ATPase subunit alpha [Alkalibacterium subtropicum]